MSKWFCLEWYRYLLTSESFVNLVCRIRNHPNGVVFYNMGWEPDMHCKDCEEDLG
jgi:hypothetical protein